MKLLIENYLEEDSREILLKKSEMKIAGIDKKDLPFFMRIGGQSAQKANKFKQIDDPSRNIEIRISILKKLILNYSENLSGYNNKTHSEKDNMSILN